MLEKPCQGNFGKFQGSGESRLDGSEKDRYFLKFPKWWHKFFRDYKRGKVVSYSLNNAAKTSLYGLKISENIEIKHVFQSEAFFCSVEISTQVASPPLNDLMRLNRFFIVIYFEHLAKLVCTVYYLH